MKTFWRYHGWEGLLCLIASVTLVLSFSQGFYIPDAVADSIPLAALVCAVVLAYCYLGSYNRATIVCFTLGFLLLAAGFFLWMRNAGIDIIDEVGSTTAVYIYWIAAPLIAAITFLLARSRLGIGALFLIGICLHAVIDFLGYEFPLWCAILFVPAVVVLFLLRQYRLNALKTSTVEPKFSRYIGLSAAVGVLGALLALACWAGIIHPLQPPVLDMELLTRYMSYEILDRVGIAKQYPVPDDLLAAPDAPEELPANQEDEQKEDEPPAERNEQEALDGQEIPDIGASEFDKEQLNSVTYDRDVTGWLVLLIVLGILLIVSIPFLRRYLRRRKLAGLTRGEPREQIISLYRFYLKKFARIGCPRAPNQTEREYAGQYAERLAPYTEGGLSLERMTDVYLDARYGGLSVSEEDRAAFESFYFLFLRNYMTMSGRVRYLTKYFVL